MRISLLLALLLLSACKHIGLLFEPPGTLKAVIQGEIKGMAIHCEKTLTIGTAKWEVMCKVSDGIDIKYRTQSLNGRQTKLEILIDKQKGDENRILISPTVIVSRDKPATLESRSDKGYIGIHAEQIR
jgi:hypothetical protein